MLKIKPLSIYTKVVLFSILIYGLVVISTYYFSGYVLQKSELRFRQAVIKSSAVAWDMIVKRETFKLSSSIIKITGDQDVKEALKRKDADLLHYTVSTTFRGLYNDEILSNLVITDAAATILYSSNKKPFSPNVKNFVNKVIQDRASLSGIDIDPSGESILLMSSSLFSLGQLIGSVELEQTLDTLLEKYALETNSYSIVVSNNYKIIYESKNIFGIKINNINLAEVTRQGFNLHESDQHIYLITSIPIVGFQQKVAGNLITINDYTQGIQAQRRDAAAAIIVIAFILGVLFISMLVQLYLNLKVPLKRVILNMKGVAEGSIKGSHLPIKSEDELGELIYWFNVFVDQRLELNDKILAEKEKQIIARHAGMAEVSATILHNVGNIINSINVSSNILKDSLSESALNGLPKIAALLKEHSDDLANFITSDPKGKLFLPFLERLVKSWENEKIKNISEIDFLNRQLLKVINIIRSHQSIGRSQLVNEPVNLSEQIEEALKFSLNEFSHEEITVIRDFPKIKPVKTDKAKLFQLLVNLIKNACESLLKRPSNDRRLTIRINEMDENNVQIHIIDNGVGIDPDRMASIFSFGYTTKQNHHPLGLHGSLLIAKELHGAIEAKSDGHNQGSQFTVTLPYCTK